MATVTNMNAVLAIIAFSALLSPSAEASCALGPHADGAGRASAADPATYSDVCAGKLRDQVKKEFQAALQYVLMGAHFAQDSVNLNGLSEMFFEHAAEERQHGVKFMQYLRWRGDKDNSFLGRGDLLPIMDKYTWGDAEEALRDALKMEKFVTKEIKTIIDVCSDADSNDYHAADWLTSNWLEEQLAGQRELAGMINTINNFRRDHEDFADWMFSNSIRNKH